VRFQLLILEAPLDALPPPVLPSWGPVVVMQAECPLEFLLQEPQVLDPDCWNYPLTQTSVSREVQRGWQVGVPYEDTRALLLQSK
jgi:hypothetical protein